MNRENLKDYSLSTNMSYDYHSAISLFNTKLNLQRQRLHQIIRCILFFNEQIKLQKQIINSYEKGNDDSNGNIYKRKNKANNNINKYVQIDYSKEYEKKENQLNRYTVQRRQSNERSHQVRTLKATSIRMKFARLVIAYQSMSVLFLTCRKCETQLT